MTKTLSLVLCGLFAALTAAFSQIAIPMVPVPINLATFAIYLAGAILGAKYGTISQVVYVLLGLVGIPVFSMFRGGVSVLFGSTGGYIIGYIFVALIVGLFSQKFNAKLLPIGMILATIVLYTFGTIWYMILSGAELIPAVMACVVPFLIGDGVKIIVATVVSIALKKALPIKIKAN